MDVRVESAQLADLDSNVGHRNDSQPTHVQTRHSKSSSFDFRDDSDDNDDDNNDNEDDDDVVPFPTITSNPLTPEYERKDPLDTSNDIMNYNDKEPADDAVQRSSSLINLLAAYEKPPCSDKDAGNKSQNHYKNKLPSWRYELRQACLPLIRWETPYLAALQRRSRSAMLDLYFALSANLGTHTFYVIMLPMGFWFGSVEFARSLVFILAFGVYITGVVKDLLCLPRPLSPPLHRLTMSGSAALEYGFPSTHSANAVSVGLLVWSTLAHNRNISTSSYALAMMANVLYVFTIVWGRIHCGMHGFCDVIVGSLIGVGLWWFRMAFGPVMDEFLLNSDSLLPFFVPVVVLLGFVWVHPEPADDCPCYDDSVAFIGVVLGVCVGQWHLARTTGSHVVPYNWEQSGPVGTALRLVVGVALISIWRPVVKRALHAALPPVYRFVEKLGISMPRKFFVPASQYEEVPSSISDSTFFEPYQIGTMFRKMSKAQRSDSVGPQSTADVYESLAYREYQRQRHHRQDSANVEKAASSAIDGIAERVSSRTSSNAVNPENGDKKGEDDNGKDPSITSTVVVPRVRYDVEVVTKLVVYSGIAYIAVDFCGVLFPVVGI